MILVFLLGAALIATPFVYEALTKGQGGMTPNNVNTDDAYALARMIASEAGSEPKGVQEAVGWIARNEAVRRGVSIYKLLTSPDGVYGGQNRTKGVYASTALAPNPGHLALAKDIVSKPRDQDPTHGALHFDSPQAQRALLAKGTKGYTKTPEDVAAERQKAGFVQVTVPGVSADRFRAWRLA